MSAQMTMFLSVFGPRRSKPAAQQKSQARRLDVTENEWCRLRLAVFERDNFTCVYCGGQPRDLHADHVLALSRGGRSVMENLAAACGPCNSSKGTKTVEEWRQ